MRSEFKECLVTKDLVSNVINFSSGKSHSTKIEKVIAKSNFVVKVLSSQFSDVNS